MKNEKGFRGMVEPILEKYFYLKKEVRGKNHKNRLDLILIDKIHGLPFGIEFKDFSKKRGEEIGEHILQAMRYACDEFPIGSKWQRIPIILCPPLSYNVLNANHEESLIKMKGVYGKEEEFFHDRHDRNHTHHTVGGMLGAMCIAEMRTKINWDGKKYFYFSSSNRILWDEKPDYATNITTGLNLVNYEKHIDNQSKLKYTFL